MMALSHERAIMSDKADEQVRAGEMTLPFDPAEVADGPRVIFIGHVHSPWKTRAHCPRNIIEARERMKASGTTATLRIAEPFRPGLLRLDEHSHIIVMYWMHEAARHIIVQRPRYIRQI
jgi:tRNA (Thr-GGU) A37 N-methylase